MEKPGISVIIPVYNTAKSLPDALESVINQSFRDIEVILVNDGSTDGSEDVVRRYQAQDDRIRLVSTPNQGPSLARLTGVRMARGEYIQFLDSDDQLLPDALSHLIDTAKRTGADMVIPKFWFNQSDGRRNESHGLPAPEISGKEYLREILSGRGYWCVWVLIRRRLFDHLKDWSTDMLLGEDVIWKTQLVMAANKIAGVDKPLINYNENVGSLSNFSAMNERKFLDFKRYVAWVKDFISKNGLDEYMDEALARFHVNNVSLQLSWHFLDGIEEELTAICRDLKKYPDILDGIKRRHVKLIKAYAKARWYGRLKLRYYSMRDKL